MKFFCAFIVIIKPIQDGRFQGCSRMEEGQKAPLPKICHTYPTMIKLDTAISYLKKIQKYIKYVTHHLSSADISIFSLEISNFCYFKKYRYRLHFNTKFLILLTFFLVFKGCSNKCGYNFDDIAKIGYSSSNNGILK